jgi:glucose 1-dehydrogenase
LFNLQITVKSIVCRNKNHWKFKIGRIAFYKKRIMKKLLLDQVAIVTGAGQGIGYAISNTLAAQGAIVILNDIEEALAEEAAKKISRENNIACLAIAGDASQVSFIEHLTQTAVQKFGKLNIVVANAGITLFGEFLDYTPEDFNNVMQTNLHGSFFLAQASARIMKDQGMGGSILFMSSVTAHQAHKNLAAYAMSKAALEMLAKTLVIELSQYRITVNAVAPGATLNERTMHDPDYQNTWSKITPLGKPALTSDVANAVAFLVSPHATHITGQTLIIDGGWSSISPSPYEIDEARSSEH